MKIYRSLLFPSFLLLSLNVYSQALPPGGLSPEFLQSLPSNLQKDFIDASNDENEIASISSPDTRILNLEAALSEAERNLENIRNELQYDSESEEIPVFGSQFFSSFQSTFIPINDASIDPEYILDYGDELTVQVLDRLSFVSKVKVKRDLTINVRNIGNISVGGLTLDRATEIIISKVKSKFAGAEAFVSLSNLRDINVILLGSVKNPGIYTLGGGSNFLSAIDAAGGISNSGSFRKILHKRDNNVIESIDLYELLLKGNTRLSGSLRSGDVLLIEPKKSDIVISGFLKNPARYEMLEGETLGDFWPHLGVSKSIIQDVEVERLIPETNRKEIITVSLSALEDFELIDGDSVKLFGIKPNFSKTKKITITGAVEVPGVYSIQENDRLGEVLKKAGGFKPQAYPLGGVLSRQDFIAREEQVRDKTYNELIRYLVASPAFGSVNSSTSEGLLRFLSVLKDYKPSGRLKAEFNLAKLEKSPEKNIILEDGDKIHIPTFQRVVYVFGEVMYPGVVEYSEGTSPNSYIKSSGSYSRLADRNRVFIVSPNGDITTFEPSLFSFTKNDAIRPGSMIYVPQQVGRVDGLNLASTVAPIISSFALSIASLNSINN